MTATDTLTVTTPSDREIVLTRVFNAPRHLVFDAYTRPELVQRWLGPAGMSVCEIDLRVGGAWRFVLHIPGRKDMGMRGVYREIVPSERLVSTEVFDDYPGEALVNTVLVEDGGRTTLTSTVRYDSQAIRDAVANSGMARGAGESYDRLAELLRSL